MTKQHIQNSRNNNQIVDTFWNIVEFIVAGLSTNFEVLVRRNFGERYFTPIRFFVGLLILGWCITVSAVPLDFAFFYRLQSLDSTLLSSTNQIENPPNFTLWIFIIYTVAYFFLGMQEFRTAFKRNRYGIKWHSYYHGDTRFQFVNNLTKLVNLDDAIGGHIIQNHVVKLYIEPLFFISTGLALILLLPILGIWFLLGGVILLIRGNIMYTRLRNEYLDQQDSLIESKNMQGAMEGKSSDQTQGFSTLALRPRGLHSTQNTAQAMREFFEEHPELAQMADKSKN